MFPTVTVVKPRVQLGNTNVHVCFNLGIAIIPKKRNGWSSAIQSARIENWPTAASPALWFSPYSHMASIVTAAIDSGCECASVLCKVDGASKFEPAHEGCNEKSPA